MKTVVKSFKIRIYPDKSMMDKLHENFGYNRFVFNQLLGNNKFVYGVVVNNPRINQNNHRQAINRTATNNWLNYLKTNYSFLKDGESTSLQSTCDTYNDSFKRFFNKQNSYPNFKSKKNPIQSIRLKNNNNSIRFEDNKLKLPTFGFVKYKDNRIIKGDILSATVKYENDRWFAVLNCKNVPIEPLPKTNKFVGIDLGLKDLMTFSNGEKRKPITRLKKIESRIAKLNQSLSRKKKGSQNFIKNVKQLHKLYNKIYDIRNDKYQKLSTEIVQSYDLVGLEKLQPKNMIKNRKLSHSIGLIAWTRLIDMIKYKCGWYDKIFVQVGRFFPSSKLCSHCGYKKDDLTLKVREWVCPECKTHHDRDINASINILNEALKIIITVGTTGI